MKPPPSHRAFTLVELIAVIALLAILVGLTIPEFHRLVERARSTACSANLRNIGMAVRNYINDHDGTFPVIETNPENPVYPDEVEARGMLETLENYGVTSKVLMCPSDRRGADYFAQRGTSYEWRPVIDGEPAMNPLLYTRRGERHVDPARVRLVMDFTPVHNGRQNLLFADGRVRSF
jgi:prepilin-type N-terminal cleavage/methylation domain-containing protein/prepilin-type processing-associated H-X9-DG protein